MVRFDYVIVVGCSRFGSNVASYLSKNGSEVIVIDLNREAFDKLPVSYSGFKIIGDGSDVDKLIEMGIKKADLIIAATDNDNVNIMISEIAKNIFNKNFIVSRLYDLEKEVVYRDLDIDVISPTKLSIDAFHNVVHRLKGESL